MELWPHQSRGINETLAAIARGERRICLTSPTGGGKTKMISTLISGYLDAGRRAVIYTNKKMLTTQNADAMSEMGITYGMRAAGHGTDTESLIQIASMQTEHSRVNRRQERALHNAELVIVEEAHVQLDKTAIKILNDHHAAGAAIVGVTATPLDMGEFYETLIVAGTNSELRACGALVPAIHYGADEPDLKALKIKESEGVNLTEKQAKKAIMTPTIFARVFDWYEKLNPERKPSILFGPGVNESLWFAEQFTKKGIPAAHIDGDDVWINGKFYPSDNDSRKAVADGSRDGSIKVVCNRYVLREGVNWPWIEHMILAYVVGSLQSYLQIGGRGLRASPSTGKTHLIVQDHGGAWWRHGSLNADRHWDLSYTNAIIAGLRGDRFRAKKETEPWRCPACAKIMTSAKCQCGFTCPPKRSRPVVQTDGSLREMTGDIYKPRRTMKHPNGEQIWERMFWRSRTEKGARTFRAAMALFARENNFAWPDRNWRFMPIHEIDFYRMVDSVPRERLR